MLFLISSWCLLPDWMQRALLLIPAKYTFHLSSSLSRTFSFSFGSAAPQFPSLPCHFAFSCVFWLVTVTLHPQTLPWEISLLLLLPLPWSCTSQVTGFSSKRKPLCKGSGLVCYLSECYFHSHAVFYLRWWMIPTFHTQRWLSEESKQINKSSNEYSRVFIQT